MIFLFFVLNILLSPTNWQEKNQETSQLNRSLVAAMEELAIVKGQVDILLEHWQKSPKRVTLLIVILILFHAATNKQQCYSICSCP